MTCKQLLFWGVLFLFTLIPHNAFGQVDIKDILKSINWPCTEEELIKTISKNIIADKQEVWAGENSVSNYCFKDVSVMGIPLSNSYIRVNRDTKLLFRLNFNVLMDETDLTIYPKIHSYLETLYGIPIKNEHNAIWTFENYRIISSFIDVSNVLTPQIEEYCYCISVEPITTLKVDWTCAIVEENKHHNQTPQIEYFRIDNENNIYIKEKGVSEIMKERKKKISTPKGEVITFDGGIFCYRPNENDIVFMKHGMAVIYPIKYANN